MPHRIEPIVTFRQALIVTNETATLEPMVTNDEREAFSRRLNEALDDAGVPPKYQGRQQTVATMFGVGQKGARKWLEAEAIPTTKRIPQIASDLNVNTEWLLSGRGPKRTSDLASVAPAALPAPPPPSADIAALLARASPRSRTALEQIAQAADAGRLTEADITLLHQIAERLARQE